MSVRKHNHLNQALGLAGALLLPVTAALATGAQNPARFPASRSRVRGTRIAQTPRSPESLKARTPESPKAERLRYNRDVRPILAENCFPCHGPDSAARKAELRLDRLADATAMRNGHAAVVKDNPAASEVVKRITGDGPTMPPSVTKKHLTARQIATLKRWIAEGAEYEMHWSYLPPQKPALPKVSNPKWCRSPIDYFILARLDKAGLKPAPEADRRTLARRLSLDLVGLPPDPADVEAFVSDRSPDAYEKLADKFMAMPQWGEHRGRYWLDAARYGDTHGIHIDNFREIWSYRDWVIHAFNKNMPFDQFTVEQLAGDLLVRQRKTQRQAANAASAVRTIAAVSPASSASPGIPRWVAETDLDSLIATGFNRCNITTSEGGAIDEEYRVLYARDRTETLSTVWLGSTLGCCVCHDHKFDPFTQKDFYSLSAFFNNSTQPAMDGNIKDTPPTIPVPMPEDRERFDQLQTELAAVRGQADARKQAARADFESWLASGDRKASGAGIPAEALKLHLPLSEGKGREVHGTLDGNPVSLTAAADPVWTPGQVSAKAFQRRGGSVIEIPAAGDFEKDQAFSYAAWVKIPSPNTGGAIIARMDDQHDFRGWDLWLEGGRVGSHIIHKWPENALKVVSKEQLSPKVWHHVCVTYTGAANPSGLRVFIDGAPTPADPQANTLKDTIRTTVPLKIGQRHSTSGVDNVGIEDVRIYRCALSEAEVRSLAQGTRAAWLLSRTAQLTGPEKDELFNWWLPGQDSKYRALSGKITALENEDRAIRMRGTIAHVWHDRPGEAMAYVLFRGEYDKRREKVTPITPAVLPALPAGCSNDRLGLAKWLLLPENPLTARVTVNRFWQQLFGAGIVRTTGDFGVTGELPSHPELLDWLAVAFRDGWTGDSAHRPGASTAPWDIKDFFKLLVTSATYRQAAVITPEKRLKDPDNRLLSRGPRFRMDGEMVRDYALAASGLLVRKIGGPSVRPYQPEGVWEAVAMIGSNTRNYVQDHGDSLYRRSMYTFWKRAAPPASMEIFNAPTREVCTVRRERTDTPLQALVTLNDVQFVEAARILAQRALKEGGAAPQAQIDFIARRLLSRPLTAREMPVAQKSAAELEAYYKGHAEDAKKLLAVGEMKADESLQPERLAAWTMLVNQLMNLDEVLSK